jgi:hypothetical protein
MIVGYGRGVAIATGKEALGCCRAHGNQVRAWRNWVTTRLLNEALSEALAMTEQGVRGCK